MHPYQISASSCLIIPDVHQDLEWVERVIAAEKGNFDRIIFTGDFFDSRKKHPLVSSTKEAAKFVKGLCAGSHGPVTILIGNHELPLMECWFANQKYSHKRFVRNACSGFTNSKSIEVNKILSWENWRKFELFCEFGGYVISHAGIHPNFWNFYKSREDNLRALWDEGEEALRTIGIKQSHLFEAGYARGGSSAFGGLVWLDFSDEFQDNTEIGPQLVGHSQSDVLRKNGESWCLDCGQSAYVLLSKSGDLTIRHLKSET